MRRGKEDEGMGEKYKNPSLENDSSPPPFGCILLVVGLYVSFFDCGFLGLVFGFVCLIYASVSV